MTMIQCFFFHVYRTDINPKNTGFPSLLLSVSRPNKNKEIELINKYISDEIVQNFPPPQRTIDDDDPDEQYKRLLMGNDCLLLIYFRHFYSQYLALFIFLHYPADS